MAIEIEPRAKRRKSQLVKYTLYTSIALLIILAAGYGLLYYFTNNSQKKLDSLKQQVNQQITGEEKRMEKRLTESQKKIERAGPLIKSHRSVYNFFTSLESFTHPQLRFKSIKLDSEANKVKLKGVTEDFTVLGQQIQALRREKKIKEVEVGGVRVTTDGRIGFDLNLILSPNIFKFPPKSTTSP